MGIQQVPVDIKIKKGKKSGFNPRAIISDNKFIQNMNFITDHYRSIRGNNKYRSKADFHSKQQNGSGGGPLEVRKVI